MVLISISTVYHFIYIQRRKADVNYTVEGARTKQKGIFHEVLLLFSVIKNVKKILHVQPNELNLECVSGIKVLSMGLILASHALLFLIGGPVLNTDFNTQVIKLCNSNRVTHGVYFRSQWISKTLRI